MGTIDEYEIHNVVNGMIDFRRNASDTSRIVFECCLKNEKLCVGFALILFNPDNSVSEHERWEIASFLPVGKDTLPKEMELRIRESMQYIASQIKRIWTGQKPQPYGEDENA